MANIWCPCLMFVWSWFIPNSCLLNSVTPVKVTKKLPLYIYMCSKIILGRDRKDVGTCCRCLALFMACMCCCCCCWFKVGGWLACAAAAAAGSR